MNRGFFEIGVYHPKKEVNIGSLYRSAFQLGAAGIFIIGPRFKKQSSDTTQAYRHIPLREYKDFDEYYENLPYSTRIVAVEFGGKDIKNFCYPERISFLLGNESYGIPPNIIKRCHHLISLGAERMPSYNVAVAGSIVMYHRKYLT